MGHWIIKKEKVRVNMYLRYIKCHLMSHEVVNYLLRVETLGWMHCNEFSISLSHLLLSSESLCFGFVF